MRKLLIILLLSSVLVSCGEQAPTPVVSDTTDAAQTTEPVSDTEQTGGTQPAEDEPVKNTYIHSISELNKEAVRDSHGADYASAGLESNFREYVSIKPSFLKTSVAFYPRIKQMNGGGFILFYQNGNHGPDIYYCLSEDGLEYEEPQVLFKGTASKLYSTCDAVVLQNGDILAVVTFRAATNYLQYPMQCGISIRRSTDNGKTWGEEQVIFRGCNWEPSILQLKSGEIQVYWTNTTGLKTPEGTFTSTGTAIVRSLDNGVTWTGDVNKAWSGQIVSQSKTENIKGVQMFSDQMPVAVELHSGRIALALETRLDRVPNFRLSISLSDDNWATALEPFKDVGPAKKLSNYCIGAGPYIGQFESGETVVSYNRKSNLTFILGDENAEKFGKEHAPYAGVSTNYWGCFDIIGTHSLITAGEYRNKTGESELNFIVSGRLYLNHRIDAKAHTVTVDGDAKEWENNTDALFVGSVSQAQTATRFAVNGNELAILCERLDYSADEKADTTSVMIAPSASSKVHYIITFGADGVRSAAKFENGKSAVIDVSAIKFASLVNEADGKKDVQAGYTAELSLPLSLIGNPSDGFVCNILLQNTDNGKKSDRDMLSGTDLSDYSTWYKVSFAK
ncbi:MAG: exo-alpha-sialidase [Ruminococcaceae bacterium]|nr:exo-alpha-sialidase [Oscillospiraceae bacterium]